MTALLQTAIFGLTINLAAAAISFYFWTENRSERYLLFWALSWGSGVVRWAIHIPAQSNEALLQIEGLIIPINMFFSVLGCYDLLPQKPWRQQQVVLSTGAVMLLYGFAASAVGRPLEMGYALFAATLAFNGVCLGAAYRSARLSGYAFTGAVFLYQFVVVVFLLFNLGREISNTIIVPLYHIPILCGIAIIAHQRERRTLVESERTLRTSFESATVGVCLVATDGRFLNVNRSLCDMLAYTKDELLRLHFNDVTYEEDKGIGRTFLADALSRGPKTTQFEKRYVRKDGGVIWAFVSTALIEQSGDHRSYLITYIQDITERHQLEEDLRVSAEETRQLYTRLASVEDDERRALHLELHDQVGANLAALRLELDVAASLIDRDDVMDARRHLASAREVSAETIAMTRDLMAELRPPALDDYGLVAALRTFAETQSARLGMPIGVTGQDLSPRPSRIVEGALFRIAHEAVMNAARHASASRVVVEIGEAGERVLLSVIDNGVGFDLEAPTAGPDHWGLKNMRERARAVGGALEVTTAPGAGTRITADAPRVAS